MKQTVGKIFRLLVTSFFAVTLVFFILRLAPGDPIERVLGPEASEVEIQKLREQLGLDLPVFSQYTTYFVSLLKGDAGKSLINGKKVTSQIKQFLTPSLILAIPSILFSFLIGIFLGIYSALYKGKWLDKSIRFIGLLGLSIPIFSLAPILVLIFAVKLGWLPVSEWGTFSQAILPVVSLVIPLSAIITRVTRNRFLDELQSPWVTVLRAKGLRELRVNSHVTRSVLTTITNIVAIQLSVVIAGTIITETIFDIPGMGSLLFEGIQSRDYPVVQGVVIYMTVSYLVVYYVIDWLNEIIDPRLRKSENA